MKNGNDPTPGNPSEEKQSELEDFIDYAQVIIGTLGHKVFVPLIVIDDNLDNDSVELFCTRSGVNATGIRTADGFVVKKGSTISNKTTKSCPEYALKKRMQYKDQIDENFTLLEDILFNTPSGASSFVCGAATNGNVEWKTAKGITLKEMDAKTE